ncbi:MAG: hypothetical protein Q7R67_00750 [bacterium]|nr:hypothetical protein [bacterium]
MKLNEVTRKILAAEIEWLPGLIPSRVEEFQVKMIDLDTLSLYPDRGAVYHDANGIPRSRLLLLDNEGVEIGGVGEFPETVVNWEFTKRFPFVQMVGGLNIRVKAESVEDALKRFYARAGDVRYILEISGYHSTLHKMPRQMKDLPTWIEQKSVEVLGTLHRALNQDK